MYSPIIHNDINIVPLKNVIVTIRDVHPAVKLFHLHINDNNEYINIMKDIIIVKIPNPPTNFNGLVEKLIIPSDANFNIFFNGYFVFPANLSFLSYSNAFCSNPTQLNSPLKNLLCSGKLFITSTTFLSTNLKSPVSFGISTSDNAFNAL